MTAFDPDEAEAADLSPMAERKEQRQPGEISRPDEQVVAPILLQPFVDREVVDPLATIVSGAVGGAGFAVNQLGQDQEEADTDEEESTAFDPEGV